MKLYFYWINFDRKHFWFVFSADILSLSADLACIVLVIKVCEFCEGEISARQRGTSDSVNDSSVLSNPAGTQIVSCDKLCLM